MENGKACRFGAIQPNPGKSNQIHPAVASSRGTCETRSHDEGGTGGGNWVQLELGV